MDVHVSTTDTAIAASPSLVERTTDHTIRFETWVGYNSTWKHFKVRAAPSTCCSHCCSPGLASLLVAGVGRGAACGVPD